MTSIDWKQHPSEPFYRGFFGTTKLDGFIIEQLRPSLPLYEQLIGVRPFGDHTVLSFPITHAIFVVDAIMKAAGITIKELAEVANNNKPIAIPRASRPCLPCLPGAVSWYPTPSSNPTANGHRDTE